MDQSAERGQASERRRWRRRAILFAGVLLVAGCGNNTDSDSSDTSAATEIQSPGNEIQASASTMPLSNDSVYVDNNPQLPPPVGLSPRLMTPELCAADFWRDENGERQPVVQDNPLIVRVDGRCNVPLDVEENGIYGYPQQEGSAPIVVTNGDALLVEGCVIGQPIQDIRGPSSNSDVWLEVVTAEGERGYFPEVNVGYVDESTLC